jgi:hypothetical protein
MAKKLSYLDNLKKEISQKGKAGDNLSRAKYKSTYGVMGIKDPAYSKALAEQESIMIKHGVNYSVQSSVSNITIRQARV